MQYAVKADRCPQILGVTTELEKGLRGAVKEKVIDYGFVVKAQKKQKVRESENCMLIRLWVGD